MPGGVDARKEERRNLREHLAVAQAPAGARVARAAQQVRERAARGGRGAEVHQQRLDDGLPDIAALSLTTFCSCSDTCRVVLRCRVGARGAGDSHAGCARRARRDCAPAPPCDGLLAVTGSAPDGMLNICNYVTTPLSSS